MPFGSVSDIDIEFNFLLSSTPVNRCAVSVVIADNTFKLDAKYRNGKMNQAFTYDLYAWNFKISF